MGLSHRSATVTASHYSTELQASFSGPCRAIVSTNEGHTLQSWLMSGPHMEHGRPRAPAGTAQARKQARFIQYDSFEGLSFSPLLLLSCVQPDSTHNLLTASDISQIIWFLNISVDFSALKGTM